MATEKLVHFDVQQNIASSGECSKDTTEQIQDDRHLAMQRAQETHDQIQQLLDEG